MAMDTSCSSHENIYRAHLKIWSCYKTRGELLCGRLRYSKLKPGGTKLNMAHLSRSNAEYVARRVPGGGVVFETSSETFDVYSEQLLIRYQELLRQVKESHESS